MREETSNWWKQAQKDLAAAKRSVISKDYEWAAFQANQAAEKSLKALFLEKKKQSVASHNLAHIGNMVKAPQEIVEALQDLNAEYTVARYPDAANAAPFEIYSEVKAQQKVKHAEAVLKWTQPQLE